MANPSQSEAVDSRPLDSSDAQIEDREASLDVEFERITIQRQYNEEWQYLHEHGSYPQF
jgi:hypothetical protein